MSDTIEETNYIGKTWLVDEKGIVNGKINDDKIVIIVNFPGSGMCCSANEKEITDLGTKKAQEANQKNKELIFGSDADKKSDSCHFYTAFYQNKADKAIKDYNSREGRQDSSDAEAIYNQLISPMISDNYEQNLANLNKLVFRGHCFGCMVISELEDILEKKLSEHNFTQDQIKNLLSAPKCCLSSPALQIDKYPKHFQTAVIVNASDRTLTNEEYCGKKLQNDLCSLSKFTKEDLVHFNPRKIDNAYSKNPNAFLDPIKTLPDIKFEDVRLPKYTDAASKEQENVKIRIYNRSKVDGNSYSELRENIKEHMRSKGEKEDKYIKRLKKYLGGHEFSFFTEDAKEFFAENMRAYIKSAQQNNGMKNTNNIAKERIERLHQRLKKGTPNLLCNPNEFQSKINNLRKSTTEISFQPKGNSKSLKNYLPKDRSSNGI